MWKYDLLNAKPVALADIHRDHVLVASIDLEASVLFAVELVDDVLALHIWFHSAANNTHRSGADQFLDVRAALQVIGLFVNDLQNEQNVLSWR